MCKIKNCLCVLLLIFLLFGSYGCTKTVYEIDTIRSEGIRLLNYDSGGQAKYAKYSVTYQSVYQGTVTNRFIVSGITNGSKASVSLTDETNEITRSYSNIAILNDGVLYIKVDPVLNLLEDKEIYVSASPEYYASQIIAIPLTGISEHLGSIRNLLCGHFLTVFNDLHEQSETAESGTVTEIRYTSEEWKAILTALDAKLESDRTAISDSWNEVKQQMIPETVRSEWTELIELDTDNKMNLPAEISLYETIEAFLHRILTKAESEEREADEKAVYSVNRNCASLQYKLTTATKHNDATDSILIQIEEADGNVNAPNLDASLTVSTEQIGIHIIGELRDALMENYEETDVFDSIAVVGKALVVWTRDDAADIEYTFGFKANHVGGCDISAVVYDAAMFDALRTHYEMRGWILIESNPDTGRLVLRTGDNWSVPNDIYMAGTPEELAAVLKKGFRL